MNEIEEIIEYLQKNKVPFALTGAPAMAVWGYGRKEAIHNADKLRYKNYDLRIGAGRLSNCF